MSKENLIPTSQRSKEEARELGRAGGIASGQSRRKKKYLKEIADTIGERMIKGKLKEVVKGFTDAEEEELTHDFAMMANLYHEANVKHNVRAIELLAKIKGELRDKTDVNLRGGVEVRVASKEDAEEINDIENL